jgi:hypothetical protein
MSYSLLHTEHSNEHNEGKLEPGVLKSALWRLEFSIIVCLLILLRPQKAWTVA